MGILAAVVGIMLYANTLGHQYTLDDYSTIKGNWIVKQGLTAESIKLILTTEYRHGAWNSPGSLYRPIPLLMFATEWELAPDDPRLGRFMNILLYGLTGFLLWLTLTQVFKKLSPELIAATVLLFMSHPIHTEVVANTKSRDEILSLLFGLGALLAIWRHLDRKDVRWLVLAVMLYGLALFSKESAITLLAVLPLTIWFFRREPAKNILKVGLWMLLPTMLYLLARQSVLDAQSGKEVYSVLDTIYLATTDPMKRLATAFMMSGYYLKTLFLPHPLVSEMGYPQVVPVGFKDWRAMVGLIVMLGLFVVAIIGIRTKAFLSYAILFFLITFSLFSNLFLIIGTSYGERLMYLPSLGFAMALAYALVRFTGVNDPGRAGGTSRTVFWSACGIIIFLYSVRTITRNRDWYNSGALYAADIPHVPNSAKLNFHHGIEVIKKGLDEGTGAVTDTAWVLTAIRAHDRSIELYPTNNPDAYHARGQAWLRLGQHAKAEADLRKAIEQRRNYGEAYSNLGVIHFHRREYREAEDLFRDALRYDDKLVDAYRNLGAVLATQGRFAEAIEQWKKGLVYEPDNGTMLSFISSAYRDMGQMDQAIRWKAKADAAIRAASQRQRMPSRP